MTKTTLKIVISVPWWVKYYLFTLQLFCRTFNTEPNPEKVAKFISKNIKVVK